MILSRINSICEELSNHEGFDKANFDPYLDIHTDSQKFDEIKKEYTEMIDRGQAWETTHIIGNCIYKCLFCIYDHSIIICLYDVDLPF